MVSLSSIAKKALRIVLDGRWGALFRQSIMRSEIRRERIFVAAQAEKASTAALTEEGLSSLLKEKPSADTFFILGAGSSINDLNPANLREIGRHRSVGINTWPIHSFIPDFYSFECNFRFDDGLDFTRALRSLNRQDIFEARPPLAVLRLKSNSEISQLAELPSAFRDRLFFYGRVTPATRKISNLVDELSWFLRAPAPRGPLVVLDSGASVVRMISLGISMGYRKIVLAGVDLDNSPYFWQGNPKYSERQAIFPVFSRQSGSAHETLDRTRRPFTAAEMVYGLSQVIESKLGGKLFVGSQKSMLATHLSVYPWGG